MSGASSLFILKPIDIIPLFKLNQSFKIKDTVQLTTVVLTSSRDEKICQTSEILNLGRWLRPRCSTRTFQTKHISTTVNKLYYGNI